MGEPAARYVSSKFIKVLTFFCFSLKSCGINYLDPYPIEYPNYCSAPPVVNQYLHRFVNFHRAPRMKYLYRCVRALTITRDIFCTDNVHIHFSSSIFSFCYFSPTYCSSSFTYQQIEFHPLIGLRYSPLLSYHAWWLRKYNMWESKFHNTSIHPPKSWSSLA